MSRIDLIPIIIVAACVLHNFIIKHEGLELDEDYEQQNEDDNNEINLRIFDEHRVAI